MSGYFQLRLVAHTSASSQLMLRFMRSYHELVYKLATSPLFCRTDGVTIFARSIQAIILELVALEMAALLRQGHIEGPKAFVVALLSTGGGEAKGEC